jgi:hypothetical protein
MRIVLEKYQSNSFSRLCPNESLFVGRSVINTLRPCSKSSKESLPKVPKLKTSFERAPGHQYYQKRPRFPEPIILIRVLPWEEGCEGDDV